MVVYKNNSYHHDIALGKVANRSKVFKFGEGTITTTPTTVWKGSDVQSGLYIYPPVAVLMDIVSDNAGDTTQYIIIQGLDKHWKAQEEFVLITGTVPVTTQYEYLRINRMSVLGGGSLLGNVKLTETATTTPIYGYISDGGFDRNQTQQAFMSIAAGHTFLADNVDLTSYEAKKTNLYIVLRDWGLAEELGLVDPPFRVQFNWNLFNTAYQPNTAGVPIAVTEKIDLELRGFTENATDQITSILQGIMVRVKSIPIDITGLVSTPATGQLDLTWDEQTPSETNDLNYFTVTWVNTSDSLKNGRQYIKEKDASSYSIEGLEENTEYLVSVIFVGYDGKTSTPAQVTSTTL